MSTVQFRAARRADAPALAALWARAFPETAAEERLRALEAGGVYGGIETAFLAGPAHAPTAAFRAYALRQNMLGAELPMMGLAAVAVAEHARRTGVGRQLCRVALRIARDRGDVLSTLYAFRPSYYASLGYGLAGSLHRHRFRPESLRGSGTAGDVIPAMSADVERLAAIYARVTAKLNGPILRTASIWRRHLRAAGVHAVIGHAADGAAYALLRYGSGRIPDERQLVIRELLAESRAAYLLVLDWIGRQGDMSRAIVYDAAPEERFEHRLCEPRRPGFRRARELWAPTCTVLRGPMVRLVNVRAALEARRVWGSSEPLRMRLEIADPELPENARPLVLSVDAADAGAEGRSVVREEGPADVTIRTDIAAFSMIWVGELDLGAAVSLGRAVMDGTAATTALAERLLRVRPSFRLLDEF